MPSAVTPAAVPIGPPEPRVPLMPRVVSTRAAAWLFPPTEPGRVPGCPSTPSQAEPVPAPTASRGPVLVVVPAHRGCGLSTLLGLSPRLRPGPWPVDSRPVVVCRATDGGFNAAGRLLAAHRADPPWGVVVVPDAAGRLPVVLRRRLRVLGGVTAAVWQIPWVETWWRHGPRGSVPTGVARVLEQVFTAAGLPADLAAAPSLRLV